MKQKVRFADDRVVDLGVSGIGTHSPGGFGVPHPGCMCGTCCDVREVDAGMIKNITRSYPSVKP